MLRYEFCVLIEDVHQAWFQLEAWHCEKEMIDKVVTHGDGVRPDLSWRFEKRKCLITT